MVLVDMILRPQPGGPYSFEGFGVATNLLAPVLSPILFMLLLLDAMMAMVYRSDKTGKLRQHYMYIALFDVVMAIVFLLYWMPFFRALNV